MRRSVTSFGFLLIFITLICLSAFAAPPEPPEKTPKLAFSLSHQGCASVAFSLDGAYIATCGSEDWLGPADLMLWDARTGKRIRSERITQCMLTRVAFSPDSKQLAVVGDDAADDHYVLNVKTWKRVRALEDAILSGSVVYAPDGRKIAATGSGDEDGEEEEATVWDASTGKSLHSPQKSKGLLDLSFTADNKQLIGISSGLVKFWSAGTGQLLTSIRMPGVNCMAISPDGSTLAVGGSSDSKTASGYISLVNVSTRKVIRSFKHECGVCQLAYSPAGSQRASADENGLFRISDAVTGRLLRQWRLDAQAGDPKDMCSGLRYSPDSKRLAFINGDQVLVWQLN